MNKQLLVLLGVIVIALTQSCNNPLLQRAEVRARFGEANILTTAVTASANLPICKFLSGKSVCVSEAGFTAYAQVAAQFKNDVTKRGQEGNNAALGNGAKQLSKTSYDQCVQGAALFVAWVFYGGLTVAFNTSAVVNGKAQIDWSPLFNKNTASVSSSVSLSLSLTGSTGSTSEVKMKQGFSNYGQIVKDLPKAKAKCMTSVFKHHIGVTCLAAAADTNNSVSGTSTAPVVTINRGQCRAIQAQCVDYFGLAKRAYETASLLAICGDDTVKAIANIIAAGTFSASVNAQLNTYWDTLSSNQTAMKGSVAADTQLGKFKGDKLQCDSDATSASDCNFICTACINATGFIESCVNNMDSNATTGQRLLQQSSIQFSDNAGFDASVQVSDSQAAAPEEAAANTSNAAALILSLLAIIAFALF